MKNTIQNFLKIVRLENFKSYHAIIEIGPLHNKFNALIGSNGSGKSNFLDAIIFVLGKKAFKIRFNRLSDIINTSNFNKKKYSSVSLVFTKSVRQTFSNIFVLNEINISRQIFKNNSSIYYFNEKEISYLTIKQIFQKI